MANMIEMATDWLLLIGGLAWGYFAFTGQTLLALLGLGAFSVFIYGAVGLSAVYKLLKEFKVVK